MQLGRFEIKSISGGKYWTDGGSMFGIVPRPLWVQSFPTDTHNRIPQATNCVLVRTGRHTVLIDTGYGPKLAQKQRDHLSAEPGDPLIESLRAKGVSINDIDTVILSHLHFDHAGGTTRRKEDGTLVDVFLNAEYVVQKFEWDMATAGWPELRNAYPQENITPLGTSGRLRLIDGDVEIVPGIRAIVTGGHTHGHQAIAIESQGEGAVYLGDACPTWRHLRSLWCMAYDLDLLQARRIKPKLLGEIADKGWWALSDHDPDHVAARLSRDDHRDFVVTEEIATLD
jgi:glyoxylase-like metal-dependent hydrolase (beta-lactamase superfamily II)